MSSNFKVTLKDYQIIKKANLEFIPGLNVIVGPSNNGKSSILKAIKSCIYTTPGASPIRAGQTSYTVGIGYNGHTVILQKGNKESVYLVDGEKYTKFGVTTPEAVSKTLNIYELVLNGNKEQLNFWDQMDYPFLIDKTPVELFRFIIDSGDNDQISQALKDMVSDRQGTSKEIDQVQGAINLIDTEIETYTKQLEEAKPIIDTCNKILELQSKVSRYNLLKDIKAQKIVIDTNKSILEGNSKRNLETLKIHKEYYEKLVKDISKLNELKDRFILLHNIIGDQSDIAEKIYNLNYIKDLKDIDSSRLTQLKEIKNTLNYISEQRKTLENKPQVTGNIPRDQFEKLVELRKIWQIHDERDRDLFNISQSIIINKSSAEMYHELQDLFDVCPVCGSKLGGKK